MKRIALFLAAIALAAAPVFAAPLKVVTTIQDLASLTKEVGGDRVDVSSIARGYQDPHFVEPKPSFLLLLRNADLLEVVGLELEIGWLPPLLDQSRNPNILPGTKGYLDVSHGVEILDRPTVVNRSMGDVHPLGNPHFWLDPANAVRIAIQIEQKLAELRPADAPYFAQRLNAFKIRINEANKRWLA
ncbi:MAG TPA: zinc ABC transporter substrate-binding protein, partial [Thermoanaerobaculia bacterium]|nr:zinc ABC transporter substrate-binding protein [Thermoanaerobaculia bacterium]